MAELGFIPGVTKFKASADFTIACNVSMLVYSLRAEALYNTWVVTKYSICWCQGNNSGLKSQKCHICINLHALNMHWSTILQKVPPPYTFCSVFAYYSLCLKCPLPVSPLTHHFLQSKSSCLSKLNTELCYFFWKTQFLDISELMASQLCSPDKSLRIPITIRCLWQ